MQISFDGLDAKNLQTCAICVRFQKANSLSNKTELKLGQNKDLVCYRKK